MGSSSAAIALPVLADDLGVSTGVSAWAISLYALMLAVATAVYGRVSDLVGIRLPLLVGVGLMTAGALVGSLAPELRCASGGADLPGRRRGRRTHPRGGDHQRALPWRHPRRCPRPGRGHRRRGELPRPAGGRQHREPARLAGGHRPADAGRAARPVPVALAADRGQRRAAGPARCGPGGRYGGRSRPARPVPVDRAGRRSRGRDPAGARRPVRRAVGAAASARLPAPVRDPQRGRGAQCPRRRGRPGGLVRPADRGAGGARRPRLGAVAGRCRPAAQRRHGPARAPHRRARC